MGFGGGGPQDGDIKYGRQFVVSRWKYYLLLYGLPFFSDIFIRGVRGERCLHSFGHFVF